MVEYKLLSSIDELTESFLNEHGRDNWRLVQWQILPNVNEAGETVGNYFHYVFMRDL